jgi:hypothetical protein
MYFGISRMRQDQFGTRSELNQPEPGAHRPVLPLTGMANDPPSDQTGYLPHDDGSA